MLSGKPQVDDQLGHGVSQAAQRGLVGALVAGDERLGATVGLLDRLPKWEVEIIEDLQ